jgi:hypothetical protein
LIASILSDVRSRWFEVGPVTVESALQLEQRIIPVIDSLLDTVSKPARAEDVLAAINKLIRVYSLSTRDIPTD